VVTQKTHRQYFEAGLEVLSELGYRGFKLAALCQHMGLTTGSFYNRFENWPSYAHQLVHYWAEQYPDKWALAMRAEPDPHRRLALMAQHIKTTTHETESEIRTWGAIDPEVREVLSGVGRQRFDVVFETIFAILGDVRKAQLFANWSTYVRVGYQQATIPPDPDALSWVVDRFVEAVYAERPAGNPTQ
jgi:AcrR family transcriptional regulator